MSIKSNYNKFIIFDLIPFLVCIVWGIVNQANIYVFTKLILVGLIMFLVLYMPSVFNAKVFSINDSGIVVKKMFFLNKKKVFLFKDIHCIRFYNSYQFREHLLKMEIENNSRLNQKVKMSNIREKDLTRFMTDIAKNDVKVIYHLNKNGKEIIKT